MSRAATSCKLCAFPGCENRPSGPIANKWLELLCAKHRKELKTLRGPKVTEDQYKAYISKNVNAPSVKDIPNDSPVTEESVKKVPKEIVSTCGASAEGDNDKPLEISVPTVSEMAPVTAAHPVDDSGEHLSDTESDDDAVHVDFSSDWDGTFEVSDSDFDEYFEQESPENKPSEPKSSNDSPSTAPVKENGNVSGKKHKILFCTSFSANRTYGQACKRNHHQGKPDTVWNEDKSSFVWDFGNDEASMKKVSREDRLKKLNIKPGETRVLKGNQTHCGYGFNEWIAIKPSIIKRHYEKDDLNPNKYNEIIDEEELIDIPGYHPHMDIDIEKPHIEALNKLGVTDVQYFGYMLEFCKQFGEALNSRVSIAAYTSSKAVKDICPKIPLYAHDKKVISIHVVAFDVIMTAEDLAKLGNAFDKKVIGKDASGKDITVPFQSIKRTINGSEVEIPLYGIDKSIYGLSSNGRKFRFYLSAKVLYDREHKQTIIAYYPAVILNDTDYDEPLDFTSQFIHPCGTEKLISYTDILNSGKWLPVPEKETEDTPKRKRNSDQKIDSKVTCNDIDWSGDEAIKMSSEELLELFDEAFPNHDHDDLQKLCAFIGNCPIDIDSCTALVQEWYDKNPNGHNNTGTVDAYMQYYRSQESNKWFWSLMKYLPADRKDYYINTFAPISVDYTKNANNTDITVNSDDINQSFGINEVNLVLNTMRGMIGTVTGRYFYKELHNNSTVLRECGENQFSRVLRAIKPFKGNWNINMFQLFQKYTPLFAYNGCKLYNPKDPNIDSSKVLNLFQRYKYQPLYDDKKGYDILNPFLEHIKAVICNGDAKRYDYFMKWWASTLKYPGTKQGVVMIVFGAGKGSGKTVVMDVMCETFGELSLNNASMKDAFGEFNPHIDTHMLCIINETPNWNEGYINHENFTRAVTETAAIKNMKGISQQKVESYINYIIVSNEPNPIKEGFENRRTMYFPVNESYIGNRDYFKTLMKDIQPRKKGPYNVKFMQTLTHYLLNAVDVDDFDPEDAVYEELRNYNADHNEKLERAYESTSDIHRYIIDNWKQFVNGAIYSEFSEEDEFKKYSRQFIKNELTKYTYIERSTKGARHRLYKLKCDIDMYSLIRYCNKGDDFAKLDEHYLKYNRTTELPIADAPVLGEQLLQSLVKKQPAKNTASVKKQPVEITADDGEQIDAKPTWND